MSDTSADVALFVPTLGGGGAERAFVTLAHGFAKSGKSVDLVLSAAVGSLCRQVPRDVNLVDLGHRNIWLSLPGLLRYLKRRRPAILFTALDYPNLIGIVAKRVTGVDTRVCVTVHTTASIAAQHTLHPTMRAVPWLYARFLPFADAVVAVSSGVADDLAIVTGLPRNRINMIYNPIVTPEIEESTKTPPDHPWFLGKGPPIVLAVGNLTRPKNHAMLMRAFGLIRREVDARLVILGEGPERSALETLARNLGIQDCVSMPGYAASPGAFMARASVFALSSDHEGLPTSMVEALACGTPVVSTDCPSGPREILENGEFGKLTPVGNAEDFAKAIVETLTSRPDKERLIARAQAFSFQVSIARYLALATKVSGTVDATP